MVIIKAKGEYYYRELQRIERECTSLSTKELADIKCKKKRIKENLDNGLVRTFRSMFIGGKIGSHCVVDT